MSLREIKAGHIGALTVTQGIVTRISDVRPMLTVATYVPEGFYIIFSVYSSDSYVYTLRNEKFHTIYFQCTVATHMCTH